MKVKSAQCVDSALKKELEIKYAQWVDSAVAENKLELITPNGWISACGQNKKLWN